MSEQTVSWEGYDIGTSKPKPFPPEGNYYLQLPAVITDEIFGTGGEGQLNAKFDPLTIRGGDYDGFEVRFTTVSTKRYSNRNACSMGDLILAARSPYRPVNDEQWKQAIHALAGQFVEANLTWEAYDKQTQQTLAKGMDNFPKLPDGSHQRYLELDDPHAQDGKRRVWANIKVRYFKIPKD